MATEKEQPGLRPDEVRACDTCHGPLLAKGTPVFYRVTIEHYMVMPDAVRQRFGLFTMFRSNTIAEAFASDPHVAKRIADPPVLVICQDCAMESRTGPVAVLYELGNRQAATRTIKAAQPTEGVPHEA
jgi:hypothetical protein